MASRATAQASLTSTYDPKPETVSHWSGEVDLFASQGAQDIDPYFYSAAATAFYELSTDKMFYASMSYSQPGTTDADRLTRWGVGDLNLGYYEKGLMTLSNGLAMDLDASASAPTSNDSRLATNITSASVEAVFRYSLNRHLFFVSRHGGSLNFYRYDTANAAGSVYNFPWLLMNSVGIGTRWFGVVFTADYTLNYMKDYADTTVDIQSMKLAATYSVPGNKVAASLFVRWRDRTLTNYSAFDTDKRVVGAGLSTFF